MFRKNLCDKVSKMKNLRLLSFSFFRADRRGVLRFFCRRIVHGENRETKSPVFTFLKKAEKRRKVRAETGVKNRKLHLLLINFHNFSKKSKTGDFVSQFSPWKMRRPKKRSTPRRSARKNEQDSHLRFFIFETLSQRFLQNIFIDFRFFEKTKNRQFCFAIFSVKNASTEKTEYTTTISAEKGKR